MDPLHAMNYQGISRFSKKQEARKVFKIQGMTLLHGFAVSPDWGKLSLQKYAYRISLALPRRDLKENRTCMSQTFKTDKWLLFWIFRRFNSSIPRLVYTILNNALCCFSCPLKRKIRSVYHKILVVRANPLHIGRWKLRQSWESPIIAIPFPLSNLINWSVSGCTSNPISPPTGILISVSCRWQPVHKAVR